MKKTYIIPATLVTRVDAEAMIAASEFTLDSNAENALESSEILTKKSSYSVWDDDWSAAE